MIDAHELMIGNLFIGFDDKVFAWDLPLFGLLDNGVGIDEIIKSPIPITEEWLEQFGFKYYKNTNGYSYYLHFRLHFTKTVDGFKLFIDNNEWAETIKSVHELQNLYFALTKIELELK